MNTFGIYTHSKERTIPVLLCLDVTAAQSYILST
jgi:hypothetical protein